MTLMNALRQKMFWYVDGLKGGRVKKYYQEIKYVLEHPSSEMTEEIKERNLLRLLNHAVASTPFYLKNKGYKSLQNFPIIDKNLIVDNYENFKSSEYLNKKLYKATSSGSTGIPFSILQDSCKRKRNTADVIYFSEQAGGALGDRLYVFKLWNDGNKKGALTSWLQNVYAHNVMDTSDDDLDLLLNELIKGTEPKNILGYPSFFEEFCTYTNGLPSKPKLCGIKSIISFAEGLKENQRQLIESFFGVPVYERYSNNENGILAQKTINSPNIFTLNSASYYFEILKVDSDEHVKPGEVGRFVVTDLFNYAMPMIRYDTGDMTVYEKSESGQAYISSVFGRRMDTIFDTKDEIVSPYIFSRVLDFGLIKQYQFVQIGQKEYVFKLNGVKENIMEDKIIEFFKEYLGKDALISFQYVDEIPLLSSGKRKKIVNEYKKS